MAHLRVGNLTVEYEQRGAGAEPIVFVHGNYGSGRWWVPIAERLPPDFTAYALDLRGCGGTRGGNADLSIRQLAEDVEGFADALGLRRFHLVGHSLGGAVALQLALSAPRRVKTLTLAAPAPADGLTTMRDGSTQLASTLRTFDPDHPPSMAMLYTVCSFSRAFGVHQMNLRQAIRRMIPAPDPSAPGLDRLVADAARMRPETIVGFLQALHRFDVSARLHRMRRPTLVIAGQQDRIVPGEAARQLADALPRARLVTWAGSGHAPQLEHPQAFAIRLAAFCRRHSFRLGLRTVTRPAVAPLNWLWRRLRWSKGLRVLSLPPRRG